MRYICVLLLFILSVTLSYPLNEMRIKKDHSVFVAKSESELKDLVRAGRNVLVYYYISSCASCKTLLPIYHQVAEEAERLKFDVVFVKIDVMTIYKVIDSLQIKSYPSLQFFKYGNYLSTFSHEKTYEDVMQFAKEVSFPLTEIEYIDQFEEIQQKNNIFIVFMGEKISSEFEQFEYAAAKFIDTKHYFVNVAGLRQKTDLKDEILAIFNQFHVSNDSLILLVNSQTVEKYFISFQFQIDNIIDFYNKNAYIHIDYLSERNLNRLSNNKQSILLLLCEESPRCLLLKKSIFYPLAQKNPYFIQFLHSNKTNLNPALKSRLGSLLTPKYFINPNPQFFFLTNNGKKNYILNLYSSSNSLDPTQQQLDEFIAQSLADQLPKLVISENIPIPIPNTDLQVVVGMSFEKEVYESKEDVLVLFKSNFSKTSDEIQKELILLASVIRTKNLGDFIKLATIDITKNKIYSEDQSFLDDIDIPPKLYYFISGEGKQQGIKVNAKSYTDIENIIKNIGSFDWSSRLMKTEQQVKLIREKVSEQKTKKIGL